MYRKEEYCMSRMAVSLTPMDEDFTVTNEAVSKKLGHMPIAKVRKRAIF